MGFAQLVDKPFPSAVPHLLSPPTCGCASGGGQLLPELWGVRHADGAVRPGSLRIGFSSLERYTALILGLAPCVVLAHLPAKIGRLTFVEESEPFRRRWTSRITSGCRVATHGISAHRVSTNAIALHRVATCAYI